ncbi:MAG: glycosyl hydrolase family 18 protein [Bacteroidota bacterium]
MQGFYCRYNKILLFLLLAIGGMVVTVQGQETSLDGRAWLKRSKEMITNYFASQKQSDQPPLQVIPNEVETDFIQRYQKFYQFLNGAQQVDYDSLLAAGLLFHDSQTDSLYIKYQSQYTYRDTNFQVFGWHPYWMGLSYQTYNYDLLSTVAYYAYDINPIDGSYNNPVVVEEWKQTDLVDMAHAANCKVQLTVTCHKTEDIEIFLDNQYNQQASLLDSLVALLELKKADGININFELTPKRYGRKFVNFIRLLSNRLAWEQANYELTMTLPVEDDDDFFRIDELEPFVNHFILMGYDYHNPDTKAGAIAPIRGERRSIEKSVVQYIRTPESNGKGIDSKKLILGLPYYGGLWSSANHSRTSTFEKHLTYRAIKNDYAQLPVNYDLEAWSPYLSYSDPVDGKTYECWYEDSTSLSRKYRWIKDHDLGGLGIWALGYDNGYPELWGAIDQSFSTRDSLGHFAFVPPETLAFSTAKFLNKYRTVALVAALFLFVFIVLGFIIALFNWKVRAVFFANYTYRLIYIIGSFICFVGLLAFYDFEWSEISVDDLLMVTAFGLLIGSGLTYFVVKRYQAYRERLP